MFEKLAKLFHNPELESPVLTKDAIADLLRISPEALTAFENAYGKQALTQVSENMFEINSRQAATMHKASREPIAPKMAEKAEELTNRIVAELLAQTEVYIFDGKLSRVDRLKALPEGASCVEISDIEQLPAGIRPQLSGNLMKVDVLAPSYPTLLFYYQKAMSGKDPKEQKASYGRFRQGLDILDLDPIMYEIIGTNPNSMGHWLPQLVDACSNQDFFKIPATTIAKVPMTLLQLTRQEYSGLTQTTLDIVNRWAQEIFRLNENKEYFIKTGVYSSKYDFRNAYVHGAKEVRELGEYLLFIHFQALQMAGPLVQPHPIYGVSTTNEWVVRDFIHDTENNPTIYKGLPLHTEYRVFVDCDTDQVIGISPYWEPKTMKQRFGDGKDANSPHQLHDYIIYKAHEDTLMTRYEKNKYRVMSQIQAILPDLDLPGQWSIDVMQNGEDFWIIDMALAETSYYYDCVPALLRRPGKEDWIPHLPAVK